MELMGNEPTDGKKKQKNYSKQEQKEPTYKHTYIQWSGTELRKTWSIYTEGGNNKRGTAAAIRN